MLDMDKVPYLKKTDIAWETVRFLNEIEKGKGDKVRPPIPMEEIVEFHLKLDFRVDDLQQVLGMDDVLGATWIDEKRVIIDERVEHEGRFMFTCAHEVGHWHLHRPLIEIERMQPSLFGDENREPNIVCRKKEKKKRGEWQANFFASCLLMPEAFVREAFEKVYPRQRQIVITEKSRTSILGIEMSLFDTARWHADRIKEAGGFENVSNEAMTYRLNELKLVVYPRNEENSAQPRMV